MVDNKTLNKTGGKRPAGWLGIKMKEIMQNKTNETIKKEAELIIAMSTDFLAGNMNEVHYVRTMARLFKTMYDRYKVDVLADIILKWSRTTT